MLGTAGFVTWLLLAVAERRVSYAIALYGAVLWLLHWAASGRHGRRSSHGPVYGLTVWVLGGAVALAVGLIGGVR